MSLFSTYIDCLNCGNELTHLSKLVFSPADLIVCDFCGQEYPGLSTKVKKSKKIISISFVLMGGLVFWLAYQNAGFISALFILFPIFILYLYTLAYIIKKQIRF